MPRRFNIAVPLRPDAPIRKRVAEIVETKQPVKHRTKLRDNRTTEQLAKRITAKNS